MKLSVKITLAVVALLGVLFALGGYLMIQSNFNRSLDSAVEQDIATHLRQQELLQKSVAEMVLSGTVHDYDITAAGDRIQASVNPEGASLAILNEGYTALFNNLPYTFSKGVQAEFTSIELPGYLFREAEGKTYFIVPSHTYTAERTLWLVSAFDLSAIFLERETQTRTFFVIYAVIILATAVLAGLLSGAITRPLRRLARASAEIAAGAYGQRTGIQKEDEVGELARSFDEMADAVQAKVDSLELSVRQREDFVGAFTHELKTPMTAMMGYAALLKKGNTSPEQQEKALDYIHSETRRLEDLSQKLLQMLGLSEEEVPLVQTDLGEVFARAQNALGDTGCEVLFPDAAGRAVTGDADLLADLLLNLIRNGIQAGPADGRVTVSLAEAENGGLFLTVADRGRGMDAEELQRIEEPFYRVDPSRTQRGSGLGLAIASRIAQLHGTRLEYETEKGAGTTVRLWLPRAGEGENEKGGDSSCG